MDATSPESRGRLRQPIIDEVINSSEASTRALKSLHNERAPISRLPREVLAAIFFLLSVFAWDEGSGILARIYVAHVCRRWRETALNHPRFWSHVNFTKLTPVGMAEILARAKMAPLHLEAYSKKRSMERFEDLGKQLEAHISHTRYLKLSGWHLSTVVKRLVSPTPTLESLTLSHTCSLYTTIPDNLFNCTAPSLTSLRLQNCDIGWKSPLFKGLRILKIHVLTEEARPELNYWLDALNEIPQLKELSLRYATPVAPLVDPLISRTVTLPSLTHFFIHASGKDCALALAHLVLPSLTSLHVHVESRDREGEDVLLVIPYVVRNVSVLQDIEPIRSILIGDKGRDTEVLTWTTPGADVNIDGPAIQDNTSRSACFMFAAQGNDKWHIGVPTAIFDALLTLLPLDSVSTLTAQNHTLLSKEFWLKHASRLPLLEQARLVPTAAKQFWEMLAEDIPLDSDGPQLPMLTKLILHEVPMNRATWRHLRDILIERVEQGVPLEYLDLRTCIAAKYAITKFAEIVVDVQKPVREESRESFSKMFFSNMYGRVRNEDKDEFDDGRGAWYGDSDNDSYEDGDSRCDEDGDSRCGGDESEDEDEVDSGNHIMGLRWQIH